MNTEDHAYQAMTTASRTLHRENTTLFGSPPRPRRYAYLAVLGLALTAAAAIRLAR